MNPGDTVRMIENPSRIGTLTNAPPTGEGRRKRVTVMFPDGAEAVLLGALEPLTLETSDPYVLMQRGDYGGASHLRGAITLARLSGKLANLIYSLNTTNTIFLPYQFKPVLQYLDSPSRGIVIADEVGLGKTIEAGLIWTELRARQDARRLLVVVCRATLREKWCLELANRFGVQAQMVDATGLLEHLSRAAQDRNESFALVTTIQALRPPRSWDDKEAPTKNAATRLARFLRDNALEEPLIDLAVVDEAHHLRNEGTQTYRFASLLRPVADGLALLTGTPIQMKSTDLFNLLHLLDQESFPNPWFYEQSVEANAPIVQLRDRLKRDPTVTREDFVKALELSRLLRFRESNEQIQFLLENLPTDLELQDVRVRAKYAEMLDRLNPRSKVITRTMKRDVDGARVVRDPRTLRVKMSDVESQFYHEVTEAVREYCEDRHGAEGFQLTLPQRQMSSCMAAACLSWTREPVEQLADLQEILDELDGDELDETVADTSQIGPLQSELLHIARQVGDHRQLAANDSKFALLLQSLKDYWRDNPGRKVVLFAFFRKTLEYLDQRLRAARVEPLVLHGGKNKSETLRKFKDDPAVQILLSSEVASEGVDLQFSSVVVNYDLPWNPARIEQRIGRIDRIGQTESRILIWNFVYENTLDERVYDRLLYRLDIFRRALGDMEEMLGADVRRLTQDLLSHRCTPEQEIAQLEAGAIAAERRRRDEEELNEQATRLLGHGDYILNKAKAARDLGRYIRGEDLYHFVQDFLESAYPGSRVVVGEGPIRKGRIELSVDARVALDNFLSESRLSGRTTLLRERPAQIWFDNEAGTVAQNVEKITQDHPLIRFVSEQHKRRRASESYFPTSAVRLGVGRAGEIPSGTYVYTVIRWTFAGPRDIERLVYEVAALESGQRLGDDEAETLINRAAMEGTDWQGVARNVLDHERVATVLDDCREAIEDRFDASKNAQLRENRDRVREMNAMLAADLRKKTEATQARIAKLESLPARNTKGLITIQKNSLARLEQRYQERMVKNLQSEAIDPRQKQVSSGVIRVE